MADHDFMLEQARGLRQTMTLEEQALWYRYLRGHPLHWYRQRVIGEYIVDFYCRAAALVIELDGRQHEELDERYADQVRDRKLEAEGLRVLRFPNYEVRYHLGRVCQAIDEAVREKVGECGVVRQRAGSRRRGCSSHCSDVFPKP